MSGSRANSPSLQGSTTDTPPGDAALVDALDRITLASVALTTIVLDEVAGPDLTLLAWRAIVVIGESTGGTRLSELADRLRISRPSATKLVQRLIGRNLVEMARDHADARGRRLRLSWEGIRVRETVLRRRHELLTEVVQGELPGDLEPGLRLVAERLAKWS